VTPELNVDQSEGVAVTPSEDEASAAKNGATPTAEAPVDPSPDDTTKSRVEK
jgi:hypothetical protein